jgi:hypothetical protein
MMKKSSNSILRADQLVIILAIAIFVYASILSAKSSNLKIIRENRRYYVLFPDSNKVEIVKDHEGGADNITILSPDSKYVFYTDGNDISFESSGKDLYSCKSDGSDRVFLRRIGESVRNAYWINKEGHNYIVFSEVGAGSGYQSTDILDLDNRKILEKFEDWELKRISDSECFTIRDYSRKVLEGTKICLDSLLSLSDPKKYNIEFYGSYSRPDLFYLSTRREPFLDPAMRWYDGNQDEYVIKEYGGIGRFSSSSDHKRTAYWINMKSKSWLGVYNKNTNEFQLQDSSISYKYGDNFIWSYNGDYLGFVKRYPPNIQEIVIFEFFGDTSYTIRKSIKLTEEKEIELIGWSTRKNGFYYMIGEKEFLKLDE